MDRPLESLILKINKNFNNFIIKEKNKIMVMKKVCKNLQEEINQLKKEKAGHFQEAESNKLIKEENTSLKQELDKANQKQEAERKTYQKMLKLLESKQSEKEKGLNEQIKKLNEEVNKLNQLNSKHSSIQKKIKDDLIEANIPNGSILLNYFEENNNGNKQNYLKVLYNEWESKYNKINDELEEVQKNLNGSNQQLYDKIVEIEKLKEEFKQKQHIIDEKTLITENINGKMFGVKEEVKNIEPEKQDNTMKKLNDKITSSYISLGDSIMTNSIVFQPLERKNGVSLTKSVQELIEFVEQIIKDNESRKELSNYSTFEKVDINASLQNSFSLSSEKNEKKEPLNCVQILEEILQKLKVIHSMIDNN